MKIKTNSLTANIVRIFVYALLFFLIAKTIEVDMEAQSFKESSGTEHFQELLVLAIALISYVVAYKIKSVRYFFLGLGSFAAVSFVREMDAWLETHFFDKGWQVLALLILIPTLYLMIKNGKKFVKQFKKVSKTAYFKMLILGGLVLHVFSRLYGRKIIWKSLLGKDDYRRSIKDASEESIELLGYMMMFIATVELSLYVYAKTNKVIKKQLKKEKKKALKQQIS